MHTLRFRRFILLLFCQIISRFFGQILGVLRNCSRISRLAFLRNFFKRKLCVRSERRTLLYDGDDENDENVENDGSESENDCLRRRRSRRWQSSWRRKTKRSEAKNEFELRRRRARPASQRVRARGAYFTERNSLQLPLR